MAHRPPRQTADNSNKLLDLTKEFDAAEAAILQLIAGIDVNYNECDPDKEYPQRLVLSSLREAMSQTLWFIDQGRSRYHSVFPKKE